MESSLFSGEKVLRERFGTRGTPMERKITSLTGKYLETADICFVSTSDKNGRCYCSFHIGSPVIRIIDELTLLLPCYTEDESIRVIRNIRQNPNVGMLFINFTLQQRFRVNGKAEIMNNPEGSALFPDSNRIIKITPKEVYRNCSKRVPKMKKLG